ncbi:MAG TPA: PEP/pyruvate-binding domain-containing protein [Candidatus Sulfomarinibacteraceae bacterium]|nr:PEP/pyruvate-binding domain-containing protein [Candidatus Sulfomarinibacteraceae bacterium]
MTVRSVIGTGPLGFTAKGLDLLAAEVITGLDLPTRAEVSVEVPHFVVLAADVFSEFLERNRLRPEDLTDLRDSQIALRFQDAELPEGLLGELRRVAVELDGPLVVRASSTLEEEIDRSITGVYPVKLIPNAGDDVRRRVRQLSEAVKLIWASTYFADAVSWRLGAGRQATEERMAVVVYRAVGSRHGNFFYPTAFAVARSYNHYPAPGQGAGEGVVTVALGLSRSVREGHAWSYCPDRPTGPPPFRSVRDLLKHSQTSFWAVDLGGTSAPDPTRVDEYLVRLGLADAERHGTLALVASTYDPEEDVLRVGVDGGGPRAVTFAPVLHSPSIPFSSVIRAILTRARAVTGGEVAVEIAAELEPERGVPIRFGLLSLRNTLGRAEREELHREDLEGEDVVAASERCLGNGVRTDLEDVVYLKPEAFDRYQSRVMATELDAVNRGLLEERRSAIFIGFGRWGTTDERYGVPVRWAQISSAQVVVEITLAEAPLNVSQRTGFFHHLMGQRVLCLTLEHDGDHRVDFDWLAGQPAMWEGRFVRHVRLERPVEVNVDGVRGRGVIRRREG